MEEFNLQCIYLEINDNRKIIHFLGGERNKITIERIMRQYILKKWDKKEGGEGKGGSKFNEYRRKHTKQR